MDSDSDNSNNIPLLNNSIIFNYDYEKTKAKVDKFMNMIQEWKYMYYDLIPPKITQDYEVKYEMFTSKVNDKVSKFVERKIELEEEIKAVYDLLYVVLQKLNVNELDYYNMHYNCHRSDEIISERIGIGHTQLSHIKKSCIIKLALALNMAVKVTK